MTCVQCKQPCTRVVEGVCPTCAEVNYADEYNETREDLAQLRSREACWRNVLNETCSALNEAINRFETLGHLDRARRLTEVYNRAAKVVGVEDWVLCPHAEEARRLNARVEELENATRVIPRPEIASNPTQMKNPREDETMPIESEEKQAIAPEKISRAFNKGWSVALAKASAEVFHEAFPPPDVTPDLLVHWQAGHDACLVAFRVLRHHYVKDVAEDPDFYGGEWREFVLEYMQADMIGID